MWQNSKTEIVTKLNNSKCDKTQKLKMWQNSKTEIVTKPKNSNCYKAKNTQIVTKNTKTLIVTILKKYYFVKTQNIKLWQN